MMVHFPITLLLMAAVLEMFSLRNFYTSLRSGINVLVFTGAGAAVLSALLGWQLSTQDVTNGSMLEVHQWSGNITALLGFVTAVLLYKVLKSKQERLIKYYRAILFFSAIGVSISGHFGAALETPIAEEKRMTR